MGEILTVGGLEVAFSKAEKWVARYVQRNSGIWSYPAYDSYPGSPHHEVAEQDLLATSLLNAHQKPITSYYTLTKLLPEINARLTLLDAKDHKTLNNGSDTTPKDVATLFGVLDNGRTPQIGVTKLSKVLHRKRPHLIPLYDKNIKRVYFIAGNKPRLSFQPGRSWEGYATAWIEAVQYDLHHQIDMWTHLAGLAFEPRITPLRALDIVAWGLGETRNPPIELV